MNLITAVGFEILNFEMYLALWLCEQVRFSTWPLQHRSLYFEQRDTVRSILVSCFLGGKKTAKCSPAACVLIPFGSQGEQLLSWGFGSLARAAPSLQPGGAELRPLRGVWAVAVFPHSCWPRPRLRSELGKMGKSAQSLKLDHFWPKCLLFKNWNLSLSFHLMVSL